MFYLFHFLSLTHTEAGADRWTVYWSDDVWGALKNQAGGVMMEVLVVFKLDFPCFNKMLTHLKDMH